MACSLLTALVLGISAQTRGALENRDRGRDLAFARDKGNCLACHVIAGGEQMGDIGPPLTKIRARFPDRRRLRAQIWDAREFNEKTLMPPYGSHDMLSGSEIDAVVEFLYEL